MRGKQDLKPRTQLRAAREARGWSRPELAARMQRQEDELRTGDEIRLDPKLVEKWESGEVRPRLFYQARLCVLFDSGPERLDLEPSARLEVEVGKLGARREGACGPSGAAGSRPRIWAVPHQRNPFFAGRDQVLDHVYHLLNSGREVVAVTQHALCGLGGVGKTQIAVEYVYRHGDRYEAVMWVRADTAQTILSDMVAIGRSIGIGSHEAEQQRALSAARAWLRDHEDWLLVLDNADDPSILLDLLTGIRGGHVLVTSRAQSLGGLAHMVPVAELSIPAGALLLLRRSGMLPLSAGLHDAREADMLLASQIVHELGGLPLAIDQAAAFLEETSCGLSVYLEVLSQHRLELMSRRGGTELDHPAPAATTLSVSLERLAATDPVAADVLRLCAHLDPDEIPEEILTEGAPRVCPSLGVLAPGALRLHQAIAALRRYSLVARNPERRALTIHRLVQACVQDEMDSETRQRWHERAAQAVRATLPNPAAFYSSLGQPARAVQVLRASMSSARPGPVEAERASALWRLAAQQQVLGRLAASERTLRECLDLCHGGEHRTDRLRAHQYLALLRAYQGLPEAAAEEIGRAESLLDASNAAILGSAVSAYRALCALLAGDVDWAAAAAAVAARESAERSGDARDVIRSGWIWGRVLTCLGERDRRHLEDAATALDAALDLCRAEKVVDYEADLLLALGHVSLVEGEADRAVGLALGALAIAERSGFRVLEADVCNLLARASLALGRRREALIHAQRALACAECDGPPYCYRPAHDVARRHVAAAAGAAV